MGNVVAPTNIQYTARKADERGQRRRRQNVAGSGHEKARKSRKEITKKTDLLI